MSVSKRIRFEVLRRDGYKCHYCHSREEKLTIDHVIPQALGGSDKPDNLVACCQACNIGKTSINPDEPLVAQVEKWAETFHYYLKAAQDGIKTDIEEENEYVRSIFDLWEQIIDLGGGYRYPLPDTWAKTARYWHGIGVDVDIIEHAFRLSRERCELGKLRIGNAYNYAAGIVGNLMRDAMDSARAWTQDAIRQKGGGNAD